MSIPSNLQRLHTLSLSDKVEMEEQMEESKTMELTYLGKVIGTCSGWDQSGDSELLFYNYTPNVLGNKFCKIYPLGKIATYNSISINTETGDVIIYSDKSEDVSNSIEVDWSVFNREKGETTDKK